ncbi:ESX-1 secretion-associated protein [Mycobacterium manitobense]|uniref:ESX-1 secretion-associated protein n=1 Tax=[Mycobacterium] manitobense TaxID=190147 RepID=A0A9X2YSV3_9MYCO|nr:ESX-1 secretion-associated protein [[Mycobacterium] manitobense]MCV7173735.1 ESX-1 secretion-associated protein [[Mycobacterium] manitobense]
MAPEALEVSIDGMRDSASGLATIAKWLWFDHAGGEVSEAAGGMSGFATASALTEVGESLTGQAKSLGNDVSDFSDKLYLAASKYQDGDIEAAENIDFAGPEEPPAEDPNATPEQKLPAYEQALRDAGLLTGPVEKGSKYEQWLRNAAENGVPPETIVDIARTHDIDPQDFDVFDGMQEVKDADGKSFFIIPPGTSPADIKKATMMTYVLNAGTDYGKAAAGDDGIAGTSDDVQNDFEEVPYSADEIQRIIDRQNENDRSYLVAAGLPYTGAAVATTPNGMLMSMGGKPTDYAAFQAGTTYGDIFAVNINDLKNPQETMRDMIESGHEWGAGATPGSAREGTLDLDRILHHEERHSQQWADKGTLLMGIDYGTGYYMDQHGMTNPLEEDAGLHDGGYTR